MPLVFFHCVKYIVNLLKMSYNNKILSTLFDKILAKRFQQEKECLKKPVLFMKLMK